MKTFDRMADTATADKIREWAKRYNAPPFIEEDPVQFPRKYMGSIADAEISGVLTAFCPLTIERLSLRPQRA